MIRGSRPLLILALSAFAGSAHAIIPDFGPDSVFTGVGTLGGASCVAIGQNWVITARHVGGMTVNFGSGNVTAIQRFDHELADISLLKFSGNPFTSFYNIDFADRLGSEATLVGFGQTGTPGVGGINITGGGGIRRKANNVIDLIDEASFGTGSLFDAYIYDLDNPTGGIGTLGLGAVANEGGLWGGDSGGGFFVGGKLVGVNSFVANVVGGSGQNDYGDWGGAVRLASYQGWITSTVPEPGSMAVMGLGIAALIRRRKSRA